MDELINDFLQESGENLDRLDQDFVKLEKEPGNPDLLTSILRTIHTIKGTCGFPGFTKLEALTHAGKSLLSLLRDGDLTLDQEITEVLLEMVGAVRRYLSEIEKSGAEGDADLAALVAKLKTAGKERRKNHEARRRAGSDALPRTSEKSSSKKVKRETNK
jgi:two-component system chemotaxis sensor kinase CheA